MPFLSKQIVDEEIRPNKMGLKSVQQKGLSL